MFLKRKKKDEKLTIIILYVFTLIGFIFGEDSSGGSLKDFNYTYQFVLKISANVVSGVNEMMQAHKNHFPLHYIFVGLLLKVFKNIYITKIIFFHISLLLPLIFYKCLRSKYKNKKSIFFFSLLIFLSPYFRSSAIWPTTDNTALIFFLLFIYFFLKYTESNKLSYYLYSFIFLFLAFYTRQYYILFIIYSFLVYINYEIKISYKKYLIIIILIISLSIPAIFNIFYYYIADISNLSNYYSKNFLNNFYIVPTIFFFYLLPFLIFSKKNMHLFIDYLKNNLLIFTLVTAAMLIFSKYFTYFLNPNGGGIIYKLFYLHVNEYVFFMISSFSLMTIFFFFKEDLKNNILLLIIIFLCFYFNTIFQKYFDPMLIILFSTLFKSLPIKIEIENFKNNYLKYYSYFFLFYFISLIYHQ